MDRILVVGATGYIGQPLLMRAGSSAIGTSSKGGAGLLQLKLERPCAFEFRHIAKDDVVFLLAAISSPDVCAQERDWAQSINVTGTIAFIEELIAREARVVFFSTDAVYGEQPSPFNENQPPSPVGDYAEMKLEVETRFAHEPSVRSVRLSYVFSRYDSFTRYLFDCAQKGVTAEVFPSLSRSVVSRNDVIEAALALAENWFGPPPGVINFGGPDVLSRAEFAAILRSTVLPNLRLIEKEPDENFFASRPRKIAMQSPIMEMLLQRPSISLKAAAASFVSI